VLVAAPLGVREANPYVAWLTASSFALIRAIAYGVLLGLSYPIFGSRRRNRTMVEQSRSNGPVVL
jgi:hypothetical protein